MGESSFWYRPTRVVPDQRPLNGRCCCCCCCLANNSTCIVIVYVVFSNFLLNFTHVHTPTPTHPFNGSFSGTTQVSRYQKSKTNLDFTEARDSGWQWHQLGHNASLQLAPDRQPHQHPTTLMCCKGIIA